MSADPNCIFCKIVAGQIPSKKVYEDEELLVLAKQYKRSWKHVLQRSALLTERGRTQRACSARYSALQQQYNHRKQREARSQMAAAGEVGPQSADPGESLSQVPGWQSMQPIDRSHSASQTGQASSATHASCSRIACMDLLKQRTSPPSLVAHSSPHSRH